MAKRIGLVTFGFVLVAVLVSGTPVARAVDSAYDAYGVWLGDGMYGSVAPSEEAAIRLAEQEALLAEYHAMLGPVLTDSEVASARSEDVEPSALPRLAEEDFSLGLAPATRLIVAMQAP